MFEEIKSTIDVIQKSVDQTNKKLSLSAKDIPDLGLPTSKQLSSIDYSKLKIILYKTDLQCLFTAKNRAFLH